MEKTNLVSLYVTKRTVKSKDGKKEWTKFTTPMILLAKGDEEKGLQHFNVDVVIQDEELKGKISKMKGRVKITCVNTEISAPAVWSIRKKKNDEGKEIDVYPAVFIYSAEEIVEAPKPVKQELFEMDEEDTDF